MDVTEVNQVEWGYDRRQHYNFIVSKIMLTLLEQTPNYIVLRKKDSLWLLTLLVGVIFSIALGYGIIVGFNVPLGLLIGITAGISLASMTCSFTTTYLLNKQSNQLIVTTQVLFFQSIKRYSLDEVIAVRVGLLSDQIQEWQLQSYQSFSSSQFLYIKFASGKLLLLAALDPYHHLQLQRHQDIVEQIQGFLDLT